MPSEEIHLSVDRVVRFEEPSQEVLREAEVADRLGAPSHPGRAGI